MITALQGLRALKLLLRGTARPPKAKRLSSSTPTTATYYEGMDEDYRWFRRDELVRRCLVTNAFFATMTAGFDTVLEAGGGLDPADYGYVKERVDGVNRDINMDLVLFTAQVKRSVYGKAGFEMVVGEDGWPSWLLSLQSPRLKPNLDRDWRLTGYRYEGRDGFYSPGEVLYFVNLPLEADHEGLSDVEPVRDVCGARHDLLREDFPEIVRTLWAPYTVLKADTSGLAEEEASEAIEELARVARAGKSIAVNESVTPTVVDLTPDIRGLCQLLDRLDQAIIANFGTPGFLVGRPVENRATAYAELEAYVRGPIAHTRRYFKRELERQWYPRLVKLALEEEGEMDGEPPITVKHRWRPVRVADIYEMAKSVAALWGSHGMGALGGRLEKAWEMMGWDPSTLERGDGR